MCAIRIRPGAVGWEAIEGGGDATIATSAFGKIAEKAFIVYSKCERVWDVATYT